MRWAAALLVIALSACTRRAPDSTPEGALRLLLERMEASNDTSAVARDVYPLLGPFTRGQLEERAHRATQLTGHRVAPSEMIAAGWFGLHFRPHAMRAHIQGDHATVDVEGPFPATEHAVVHLIREGGLWKVEIVTPDSEAQ